MTEADSTTPVQSSKAVARPSAMVHLFETFDWRDSALGAPAEWSPALQSTASRLLASDTPAFLLWGPRNIIFYNDGFANVLDDSMHPQIYGMAAEEVWSDIWDDIGPEITLLREGRSSTWNEDLIQPLGYFGKMAEFICTYRFEAIADASAPHGIGGVYVTCVEAAARTLAERRSIREIYRLRRMFSQAPGLMCVLRGPDHRFEIANAALVKLLGRASIAGQRVAEALPEAVQQGYVDLLNQVYWSGRTSVGHKKLLAIDRGPDAGVDIRFVDFVFAPLRDDTGDITGIFCQANDVTAHMAAEVALKESNEALETRIKTEVEARVKAESALRQKQKMEAVGQLAGGIAHDLNNMLSIIIAALDLAENALGEHYEAVRSYFDTGRSAIERAGQLNRRILAFSRNRPLKPDIIDINALVANLQPLLQHSLESRLQVEYDCDPNLWKTRADPNQLENAIINLVVNARDAIEEVGKVRVETRNVVLPRRTTGTEPVLTDYVAITVTDNGSGMTPEVQEKVFEPFFTTKPEGKGSGMGLSQVYGFVKQSGGTIDIMSKAGKGTKVRLYLPRLQE